MEPLLTEDSEVVSKLLKDSMFSDIDALVRFNFFFPCLKLFGSYSDKKFEIFPTDESPHTGVTTLEMEHGSIRWAR